MCACKRERGREGEREREREREREDLPSLGTVAGGKAGFFSGFTACNFWISATASTDAGDSSAVFSAASFEEQADDPMSAEPEVEPVLGFPGASIVGKSMMSIRSEVRLDQNSEGMEVL